MLLLPVQELAALAVRLFSTQAPQVLPLRLPQPVPQVRSTSILEQRLLVTAQTTGLLVAISRSPRRRVAQVVRHPRAKTPRRSISLAQPVAPQELRQVPVVAAVGLFFRAVLVVLRLRESVLVATVVILMSTQAPQVLPLRLVRLDPLVSLLSLLAPRLLVTAQTTGLLVAISRSPRWRVVQVARPPQDETPRRSISSAQSVATLGLRRATVALAVGFF